MRHFARRAFFAPAAPTPALTLPPVYTAPNGSAIVLQHPPQPAGVPVMPAAPALPPAAGPEKVIMSDSKEALLLENAGASKCDKDGSITTPYGPKLFLSDSLYLQWNEKRLAPKRAGLTPKIYDNVVLYRIFQSAKPEDQGVFKTYSQQTTEDEAGVLEKNLGEFMGHKKVRAEKSVKGRFV